MRTDIQGLIDKYQGFVDRVNQSIKEFPDNEVQLLARKNVYLDIIVDLKNVLELRRSKK